jgi:flavin reductase (DIM6/NTAB) family NADH-FMN oxidoreductase RutF
MTTHLDATTLRRAFAAFPSGVTAVCGLVDGRPRGMAASAFTPVSLDPPLVSVCVAFTSTTWPVLRSAGQVGISVLAEEHAEITRSLAARTGDRFAGVAWHASEAGAVFVDGAALWLTCRFRIGVPAGDHTIALFHVEELHVFEGITPLVFHGSRFRRLANG